MSAATASSRGELISSGSPDERSDIRDLSVSSIVSIPHVAALMRATPVAWPPSNDCNFRKSEEIDATPYRRDARHLCVRAVLFRARRRRRARSGRKGVLPSTGISQRSRDAPRRLYPAGTRVELSHPFARSDQRDGGTGRPDRPSLWQGADPGAPRHQGKRELLRRQQDADHPQGLQRRHDAVPQHCRGAAQAAARGLHRRLARQCPGLFPGRRQRAGASMAPRPGARPVGAGDHAAGARPACRRRRRRNHRERARRTRSRQGAAERRVLLAGRRRDTRDPQQRQHPRRVRRNRIEVGRRSSLLNPSTAPCRSCATAGRPRAMR